MKSLAITLLLLAFLAAPSAAQEQKEAAPDYVSLANHAIANNDLPAASYALAGAIADNPRDASLVYQSARVLLRMEDFQAARYHFVRANELSTKFDGCHEEIGDTYMGEENYTDAVYHYRVLVSRNPGRAQSSIKLAQALEALGDTQEARYYYMRAAELDPSNPKGEVGVGTTFTKQSKYNEAHFHFAKAVESGNDLPYAYSSLGHAFLAEGEASKAEAHYRLALAEDANYGDAYYGLGVVAISRDNLDDARYNLMLAVQNDHRHSDAFLALGQVNQKMGYSDDAIYAYEKYLALKPYAHNAKSIRDTVSVLMHN